MLLSSKGLGCPQTHHQLTFEVSLQRVWDEIPTHDDINLDDKYLDAGCWYVGGFIAVWAIVI